MPPGNVFQAHAFQLNPDPQLNPGALFGESAVRELEVRAQNEPGSGEGVLMERAGAALLATVRARYPAVCRLGVLCGPGNNGGDGFVLARLALAEGYKVTLHAAATTPSAVDAQCARAAWLAAGGAIHSLSTVTHADAELWIDCLFGIGLRRDLAEPYFSLILALNRSGLPVLAADVPSGLNIETGSIQGIAVRAEHTVTMLVDKWGLHTGPGVDYAGQVEVATLALPQVLQQDLPVSGYRFPAPLGSARLPRRRRGAHKGDVGHVLVVGGAPGYSGAARLCAQAALRAGGGRVSLATHPEHAAFSNLLQPELMVHAVANAQQLRVLLEQADVVALGPGLGQAAWGRELWLAVADWSGLLVVDADALNLLGNAPRRRTDWVLTPHPGEAGRLLGTSAAKIEADRLRAGTALQRRYGGVVVLKGAGSLVLGNDAQPTLCVTGGHPGMATAGMGDVLTGVIAALMGQGVAAFDAAALGVAWHAAAAASAAESCGGEIGILAGDVVAALPRVRGSSESVAGSRGGAIEQLRS